MGCMAGTKRINSGDYVGTCRYEGQPSTCEFVNIENGCVVAWTPKGEDKVFTAADFSDVKVVALAIAAPGMTMIIGAKVKGVKMAFQLEYTRLGTNENIVDANLDTEATFNKLVSVANRAPRIANFLRTINSTINLKEIKMGDLKRLIMKHNIKIEQSFDMIMSSF